MNICGKNVLGSGNSKYNDMVADTGLVWSSTFKEEDVAAVAKVK